MESASKLTKNRRVKKPVSRRVHHNDLEQEGAAAARQPASGRSIDKLPAGPGTRALRQAAVLQMQRTHGNGHVMRQLDPAIQRQEEDESGSSGTSAISGSGGRVDTGGGGVEISGGVVKVHSGLTEVDGVLKTDTIIADNVIGSNYTPGAGNIY